MTKPDIEVILIVEGDVPETDDEYVYHGRGRFGQHVRQQTHEEMSVCGLDVH